MKREQFLKNLKSPTGVVDVVLDTDAFNEVDDRYAIAYLLRSKDRLNTKAIYAAPFISDKVTTVGEGMQTSYDTILEILNLLGENVPVFKGAKSYLKNKNSHLERFYKNILNKPLCEYKGEPSPDSESGYVDSPAVRDLVSRAKNYSPEKPLYVVCIGAITNIASAILMDKSIVENIVVVWLGGKAWHHVNAKEFNLVQDYNAVRTVMSSGVPFVQLPCLGVVSHFKISKPEIDLWLKGTTPIADYLAKETVKCMNSPKSDFWSTSLYDVAAVAWLINDNERFMNYRIENVRLPDEINGVYQEPLADKQMCYVFYLERDPLMKDLIDKITNIVH